MPNDKIAVLGLALLREVTPCVSDICEVCFTAHFGDSVGQEDTVLAAMLVERRICMPKSVACPKSAKLVQRFFALKNVLTLVVPPAPEKFVSLRIAGILKCDGTHLEPSLMIVPSMLVLPTSNSSG